MHRLTIWRWWMVIALINNYIYIDCDPCFSKWNACRATGDKDVTFKVLYCGICHSDLHMLKNEWGTSFYPLIPGYVFQKPRTEVYTIFFCVLIASYYYYLGKRCLWVTGLWWKLLIIHIDRVFFNNHLRQLLEPHKWTFENHTLNLFLFLQLTALRIQFSLACRFLRCRELS
jgi:hypothetical protein